jgi:hypothetical protein
MCDTILELYSLGIIMPISLRLPTDIEMQIAGFGAREGLSKSAVIVRSIQEFLARNAQPSSFDLYKEALQSIDPGKDGLRLLAEQREGKLQLREAVRNKHAQRAAKASQALKKKVSA